MSSSRQLLESAWTRAQKEVDADPEDLEKWERLVELADELIASSHASHRDSLRTSTSQMYNGLLNRFPLLFGYWLKFAESEQTFAGEDAARTVYERAVAAFPISVDLWTAYGEYLIGQRALYNDDNQERERRTEEIRIAFSRGIKLAGRDFLSHPMWDKYIEFENSIEPWSRQVARALKQVVQYPLHQYARFYDMIVSNKLVEKYPEVFGGDFDLGEVINTTVAATNERWQYESKINRTYFHVLELEQDQLDNWTEYLDFEESQGDFDQTRFLYERALTVCALYDKFWLRYTRWISMFPEYRESETRNVFRRACTIFVPIARPFIRFQWALYEESIGNILYARDIIQGVQDCFELEISDVEDAMRYRLAFERRQGNGSTYIETKYQELVDSKNGLRLNRILGILACEKARAVDNLDMKRQMFESNLAQCLDSECFLVNYFNFEAEQVHCSQDIEKIHELWKRIVRDARIAPTCIKDISDSYLSILDQGGEMAKWIEVDLETYGSFAIQKLHKEKLGTRTDSRLQLENGHPGVEIYNENSSPFTNYFNEQERYLGGDKL